MNSKNDLGSDDDYVEKYVDRVKENKFLKRKLLQSNDSETGAEEDV